MTSSAALCRRPPQAPGNATEPLRGPQPPPAHHRPLRQALPRRGRVNARLPLDTLRCTTALPACARTQANSAAQWPRLPQAPGAATEPLRGPQPPPAHRRPLRRPLPRWGASMPGFRGTHCAPQVVTVHHRPAPLNQRSHVSACAGRPSQAQSPASTRSPHRCYRSTRCMGTVHQPRSRVQRSGATHSRSCLTSRHRSTSDWPARVLAKWTQRGTVATPSAGSGRSHRAASWSTTAPSSPPPVAPGTAAPGRVNAWLPQKRPAPPATVCQPAASSSDADTLRATAAPPGTDFVRRSAYSKAGSHGKRFACVSQSAGALHPRSRLASHRVDCRGSLTASHVT